jgi:squalene-associated FAD-dependent desaturase
MRSDVLVIGGGLAGLAAACELADAGLRPTLVEKRPFLGGRAYSFMDGRHGWMVDNGQHVFLACCTEYVRFLERLRVRDKTKLQPRLYLPIMDKLTGRSVLRTLRAPAPLHLLVPFLRFRPLSMGEKLVAMYALWRLHTLDRARQWDLDSVSFGEWLRAHGQGRHVIQNFWDLIIRATLNEEVDRVSADLAAMVFQEGLLWRREASAIGYARVGLSELAEAARDYLEARGGVVVTGRGVREVVVRHGQVVGAVTEDGQYVEAGAVVCAVPPDALLSILPPSLQEEPFFARFRRIEFSPIVNVHLWYEGPVMKEEMVAFLNSSLQWAFNKSRMWGLGGPVQYVDISLSAAHHWVHWPGRQLQEVMVKEMMAFFPRARATNVMAALVVKQPKATFTPRPGIRALRPGPRTPVRGLFLAGDWTATGWPATMESAVRSGLQAARACLAAMRGEVGSTAELQEQRRT